MKALFEIFQDSDGSVSFMRVVGFLVVLSVVAKNFILSIKSGASLQFTNDELVVIGIIFGAKVAQKPFEKPAPIIITTPTHETTTTVLNDPKP